MSEFCKIESQLNFKDLPLHSVLYEWLVQNVQVPPNAVTWGTHIGLFLLTWYMIKFTMRMVFAILWPVVIISTGLMIFHTLHYARHEDLFSFLLEAFEGIYHWMLLTVGHIPEMFVKLFATDSGSITW